MKKIKKMKKMKKMIFIITLRSSTTDDSSSWSFSPASSSFISFLAIIITVPSTAVNPQKQHCTKSCKKISSASRQRKKGLTISETINCPLLSINNWGLTRDAITKPLRVAVHITKWSNDVTWWRGITHSNEGVDKESLINWEESSSCLRWSDKTKRHW